MKVGNKIISIFIVFLTIGIVLAGVGNNPVYLKTAHKGITWGDSGFENLACDTPAGKPYGWHFVMNQIDGPSLPISSADLNVDFADAGNFTIQAAEINQKMAHFYVYTATKDTINDAISDLPDGYTGNEVILSHFCETPRVPEFPTAAIPALLAMGGYLALRFRRD